MSLAIRIGTFLERIFYQNPNGISLKDIVKEVAKIEPISAAFVPFETVKAMCFQHRPDLESHDITKHGYSTSDYQKWWKYEGGKYFMQEGVFTMPDRRDIRLLRAVEKDKEEFNKHEFAHHICETKIKKMLKKSPEGITMDYIINELKLLYPLDRHNEIGQDIVCVMRFDHKKPFETVYLDRMDEKDAKENLESALNDPIAKKMANRDFVPYKPFIFWMFKDGRYYPTEEFLKEYGERLARRGIGKDLQAEADASYNTLLGQVAEHCRINGLTNNEFLRMYLLMQANMDAHYSKKKK